MYVSSKWTRRLIWGGNLLLLVVILILGGLLIAGQDEPEPIKKTQIDFPIVQKNKQETHTTSLRDYSAIWTKPMEPGVQAQPPSPTKPRPPITPKSKAPPLEQLIKIHGIYAPSMANITSTRRNNRNRNHHWYKVGEALEGARIKEIRPLSVVFEYQGKDVIVHLEMRTSENQTKLKSRVLQKSSFSQYKKSTEIKDNEWVIVKQEVENIKVDPLAFIEAQGVEIAPRIPPGGKVDGYALNNFKSGSLIEQRGFQKGDVFKKVNNVPVTSMSNIMKIVQEYQDASEMVVEVERDGQPITLRFHVQP